ncbi:Uncharacterized protein BM_BM1502 [Brugia malayi]|uniref:Bm1502, isoform a n=1 Tax=Brugia malayi TaxID=6279 RepID=A0A1P6BNT8_BRUMA|nr:Uncharacterized protein BM_BM1502 [Brugia malayi]CDQ00500.1 Bm1502, isoform a [Brugia malayi]VIO86303.1 Uncharacterized protein BM_BM1502 [Brugia malayi]
MQLKITKATRPNCHPSSILLKYTTSTPKKGHDGRRPLYPTLTYSIPMVTTRFIGIMVGCCTKPPTMLANDTEHSTSYFPQRYFVITKIRIWVFMSVLLLSLIRYHIRNG